MFDPKDFFYLAKKLHSEDTSNIANIRTCINRAYYAAFLTVRELSSISDDDKKVHTKVIQDFKKKNLKLGQHLSKLFMSRKDADYILEKSVTIRESEIALQKSEIVLKGLGKKLTK